MLQSARLGLGSPPHGFSERVGARGVAWLRDDLGEALVAAGLGPDDGRALDESELGGRAPLGRIDAAGRTVLVRAFRHGGLLGRLTGRRFRDPRRPFVELGLAVRLAAIEVPVAEVVAARARRAGPPGTGWLLDVATLGIPDSRDLGAWLGKRRRGEVSPRAFHRLTRAAGRLVARMQSVGFEHADLQPANLLAVGDPEEGSPGLLVLDLDRSRFRPDLDDGQRHGNLARLWRHVRCRELRFGPVLGPGDRARFLVAWARGTRRGDWRAAWRAIHARESRGRWLHAAGWFLESIGGGRPDPRAQAGSGSPLRRTRG